MRTVTIGKIAEQLRGVSYAKGDATDAPKPGFSPILRANNIGENGLNYDSLVYVPDSKIKEKQRIQPGDVVIAASSGSLEVVGKAARAVEPFDGAFGAFCKVLRPNGDVDPAYFAHFFKTKTYRQRISSLAAGANINNLKNEHLDDFEIPLPPLAEQKRIAAILDAADELRTKRRESLAQLDTLLQSTFLDLFGDPVTNPNGWETRCLGEVCDVRDGTHDSPKYVQDGYPLLTSKNFKNGGIDLTAVNYISRRDYDEINKRSKVDQGDLVMPMIGTVGNPVLIEEEPEFAIKNVALFKFRPDSPDNRYVQTLLCSHYFDHVTARANRGGSQKFVALKDLRGMPIPIPPVEAQRKFAKHVKALNEQRKLYVLQLNELDTLFTSLQSRAFRGEL